MKFYIIMIVVAVALFRVDAGVNKGGRNRLLGGWNKMKTGDVPSEVSSGVAQQLIGQLNSEHGIRMAQITKAKYQVVSGKNYKLAMLFHVTQCPASANPDDIKDESACPQTSSITCNVKVYHQPWTSTLRILNSKCVP